ncbi:MAG TPA: ceramidase domain-containing protein [Candidatus Methylomirabilis sp.]|nr:ceramidase domain-containing protein [Candidatus Methylomirabilis sp.]
MRPKARRTILLGIALLVAAFFYVVPPIPQDIAYHDFADKRTLFGLPNFWNVTSNLSFVMVGLVGMRKVWRGRLQGGLADLRAIYFLFFLGLLLTGLGSGYYHLVPSNRTLVWDRLPMAVVFMAFFSAVLGEQWSARLGRSALIPLVVLGVLSVFYWEGTELIGHGDLRPYVLVQFLPMLLLPILLLGFPSALTGPGYVWAVLAGYTVAKLCEWQDAAVLQVLGQLSGHTLKHVSAAAAGYIFLLALERRHIHGTAGPAKE